MPIDTSVLPYPKTDKIPIPANEDSRQYIQATDWNALCGVVDSVRDSVGGGIDTVTDVKVIGGYVAAVGECVRYDPTGGSIAMEAPTAVGVAGGVIEFKNVSSSVLGLVVTPFGAQTFDGDALIEDFTAYGSVTIRSDGANWMIIPSVSGGGSGDMVLADIQTVSGAKSFNAATLKQFNAGATFSSTLASAATANRTWTLPDATDTAVGLAATQTLTNKTITAPVLSGSITGTYTLAGTPTLGANLNVGASIIQSTTVVALKSSVADGASAVAVSVDTSTAWSNAAARLLSLQTNAVEKLYVLADGGLRIGANSRMLNAGTGLFSPDGSNGILFYDSILVMAGVGLRPGFVGTQPLGTAGYSWSEICARKLTTDPATALTISSNTIAPTRRHHTVGAGLLKTMTNPDPSGMNTEIYLIPTAAFTWDATDNIASGTGTAVIGSPIMAIYDNATAKWYLHQ